MKTIILIVIALLSLQVAIGIDTICHLTTLDDPSWSEAKCWCSQIDEDGNEIWYTDKYEFAAPTGCNDKKVTKCECTERTDNLALGRFGGEGSVLVWEPETGEVGSGYPNSALDQ